MDTIPTSHIWTYYMTEAHSKRILSTEHKLHTTIHDLYNLPNDFATIINTLTHTSLFIPTMENCFVANIPVLTNYKFKNSSSNLYL